MPEHGSEDVTRISIIPQVGPGRLPVRADVVASRSGSGSHAVFVYRKHDASRDLLCIPGHIWNLRQAPGRGCARKELDPIGPTRRTLLLGAKGYPRPGWYGKSNAKLKRAPNVPLSDLCQLCFLWGSGLGCTPAVGGGQGGGQRRASTCRYRI